MTTWPGALSLATRRDFALGASSRNSAGGFEVETKECSHGAVTDRNGLAWPAAGVRRWPSESTRN